MTRLLRKGALYASGLLLLTLLLYRLHAPCGDFVRNDAVMVAPKTVLYGSDRKQYVYDRQMPLIFVGGVPRSGTTLSRAMLDAHPDIRCGEETRVIPRMLQMRYHWLKSQKETMRLEEAGLTNEVLDAALAAFILEVIARHGEPAPRLCNKDPFTLKSAVYLGKLFPNAKFILMVRDGRAVVHSVITRKVSISGFDLTSYRQCLTKWNTIVQAMHQQCSELGSGRCLHVYYEQMVLHPRAWMERILSFLDVPWNDSVLHHEHLINKPGGVSLSKVERSTDQVIKPINLEALNKWVGQLPADVVEHMAEIAPMLAVLGYDPAANPPNYGSPDAHVADNTQEIRRNGNWWQSRVQQVLQLTKKSNATAAQQSSLPPPGSPHDNGEAVPAVAAGSSDERGAALDNGADQ